MSRWWWVGCDIVAGGVCVDGLVVMSWWFGGGRQLWLCLGCGGGIERIKKVCVFCV